MSKVRIYQTPPAGVGKDTFSDVVAAAHMAYMLWNKNPENRDGHKKNLPPIEEIGKYCKQTDNTVARVVGTPEFLKAMRERGVYWDSRRGLSPEQTYAIGILTDISNRRDLAGKLKQAGITMQTYRSWLKQPLFADAIRQIGEDLFGDHMADVNTALMTQATSGNMKAIDMYMQMTGRFDPQRKQVEDLHQIINLLLETIFRHVSDTTILGYINNDFQKILSGRVPEAELIVDGEVIEEVREIEPKEITEAVEVSEDEDIPPGFFEFTDIKDF